jgi:mannose-6-phosphate isomerase-like protein (cupin superfamily)
MKISLLLTLITFSVILANNHPLFDQRPWGSFTVLDHGNTYKVKRIEVLPGKRLSYQMHNHRAEYWMIVQGTAKVVLDGKESILKAGDTVFIPIGMAHRIGNIGDELVIFIEIQRGDYLGEDDIIRIEDDYGRNPCCCSL